MENAIAAQEPSQMRISFDGPVTSGDVRAALVKGRKHKAPGTDGFSLDFYRMRYDVIGEDLCEMLRYTIGENLITPALTQGTIVCLPKQKGPEAQSDYRPITLLNAEYKLIARILMARLTPVLGALLNLFQHSGVPGKGIMDVIATVCDVIALAETTRMPVCVMSLDFSQASLVSSKYRNVETFFSPCNMHIT
jgi:hypothetical protein